MSTEPTTAPPTRPAAPAPAVLDVVTDPARRTPLPGGRQDGTTVWDDGVPRPAERQVIDWLLSTTRANRKTLDLARPVEPEIIEECLRLAIQAPAAHNEQRWHFMVITDPDKRKFIADVYRKSWEATTRGERRKVRRFKGANQAAERNQDSAHWLPDHLHEVPVMVIPCLIGPQPDASMFVDEWEKLLKASPEVAQIGELSIAPLVAAYWATIYPAVWSFQLALRSRGLGSVITVMHLAAEKYVAKELGIPDNATQACLLPVGYVTKTDFSPARRAPLETRSSWNTWLTPR